MSGQCSREPPTVATRRKIGSQLGFTRFHRAGKIRPSGAQMSLYIELLGLSIYTAAMRRHRETTAFARPLTAAAQCLHLIRLAGITTRPELITATGLSQPTITRAVAALLDAGLIRMRKDLTTIHGRGRPIVPLEMAEFRPVFIGAAVGNAVTHLGVYDAQGHQLTRSELPVRVAETSASDFLEHLIAAINRSVAAVGRPLGAVGVTTPGQVTDDGVVTAPSLGWQGIDLAGALIYHFAAPVTVAAATPAILGAETQHAPLPAGPSVSPTMAFVADDSLAAAVTQPTGTMQITGFQAPPGAASLPEDTLCTSGVLATAAAHGVSAHSWGELTRRATTDRRARSVVDSRAQNLAAVVAGLTEEHRPCTAVLAGSAFTQDRRTLRAFVHALRSQLGRHVELRLIPGGQEILAAVTRAVALDQLLREPLKVAASVAVPACP